MNPEILPHEDKAMKKSSDEYFGTHTVPQSVPAISNEARHPRVREQIAYLLYEYLATEAQIFDGRYQVVTEPGDHETSHGES